MPATGGEPRQLTFFSGSDAVLGWTPDGQRVLFSTSRGPGPWGSPALHRVEGRRAARAAAHGPRRRRDDQAGWLGAWPSPAAPSASPARATSGNSSDDVWVQDLKTKTITPLTDTDRKAVKTHVQDVNPMWGADGHDVLRVRARRLLQRLEDRARRRRGRAGHVIQEGRRPVRVDEPRRQDHRLRKRVRDLDARRARRASRGRSSSTSRPTRRRTSSRCCRRRARQTASTRRPTATAWRSSSTARSSWCPRTPRSARSGRSPRRRGATSARSFSPNGRYIAYISDESKEQEFWLFDRQDGARRKLTTHASFKDDAVWSPDSKRLAVTSPPTACSRSTSSTNAVTEVAYNQAGGYQVSQFSPDGKWLIYTRRDDRAERATSTRSSSRRSRSTTSPRARSPRCAGVLTPDGAEAGVRVGPRRRRQPPVRRLRREARARIRTTRS